MAIGNPYIERNVYSPQATATRGLRTRVPTRLTGSFQRAGMIPAIEQELVEPTPLRTQAAIFAPDATPASGGVAGDIGGGPPGEVDMSGPNAVSTGMMSQATADAFEGGVAKGFGFQKGEQGYEPTVQGFLGTPALLASPGTTLAEKAISGIAKKAWERIQQSRSNTFEGLTPSDIENSVSVDIDFANLESPPTVSILGGGSPPSSLADIDFGGDGSGSGAGGLGGFGTGFGHGGFGAGAVGGYGGDGEGIW